MAKYAMLNCWDDLNRGDLGIMISIVEEIKRQDFDAEIIGISCFNEKDNIYKENHEILKKYVSKLYPAIYGVLGLNIKKKFDKSPVSKIIAFLLEDIRYYLMLIMPRSMVKLFLTKSEKFSLNAIMTSDICFSKGGSFFEDDNSRRGKMRLRRLCRLYMLLNKVGCRYYILAQSFGPVHDKHNIQLVNKIISCSEIVFIREKYCVKKYKYLKLTNKNVKFSNDAAFLMDLSKVSPNPIDINYINIGLTVRCVKNRFYNDYIEALVQVIEYLSEKRGFKVNIFRQVAAEMEPDNITAKQIMDIILKKRISNVVYHTDIYKPQELCWLYGQMDAFIGTRLHSSIFAMRAGTPALGIVYQGTKAQGIFANIGVPELIIEGNISADNLIERFDYLWENRERLKKIINNGVQQAQKDISMAINEMINQNSIQ